MGNTSLELGHSEQPITVLSLTEALRLGLADRIERNGIPYIALQDRRARQTWAGLGGLMQLGKLRQQPQEGEQ